MAKMVRLKMTIKVDGKTVGTVTGNPVEYADALARAHDVFGLAPEGWGNSSQTYHVDNNTVWVFELISA